MNADPVGDSATQSWSQEEAYDPDPAASKEVEPSSKKPGVANIELIDTVAVDENIEIIDDENVNVIVLYKLSLLLLLMLMKNLKVMKMLILVVAISMLGMLVVTNLVQGRGIHETRNNVNFRMDLLTQFQLLDILA